MSSTGGGVQSAFYSLVRWCTRMAFKSLYRARVAGLEHLPLTGPVLIAGNHQSHLDPPLIGCVVTGRELWYVARSGLFSFKPFGWFISALRAIPIREDDSDAGAIRQILARLGDGHAVVIFPEGSRTPDGAMHEFKRGIALLVKRAKCPVVPAAVGGCYEAWPRHRRFPALRGRVWVRFGPAISHDELMKDGPDAALRRLEREVAALISAGSPAPGSAG